MSPITNRCRESCLNNLAKQSHNITLETMLSAITQAKELGFVNIVFTGGEPTLRWHDLIEAIRHADRLKMPTRLVTNAYWACDMEETKRRVRELCGAGLKEINISTGDEHARFVPIDKVVNAIVTALEHSLLIAVMIEIRADRIVTKTALLSHPKLQHIGTAYKERLKIVESPWMPLNPMVVAGYPEGYLANTGNISSRGGCDSVLQTYVVQASSKIGACCGLGMRIVPELNVGLAQGADFLERAIQDAESDLLKLMLRYKGPEKILAWAATKDPEITWENMYAHKCQACLRIYKDRRVGKVIKDHHAELIPDILQSAWIAENLYPNLTQSGHL
jgi:organic radical activating enzyme